MPDKLSSLIKGRPWIFYPVFFLILVTVMLAIHIPAYTGPTDFNGDDSAYILENDYLKDPSLSSLAQQLTRTFNFEYIPVTMLSFNIDAALFGLNPKTFRIMNIIIYSAIGALLFSFCMRMNTDGMPHKSTVLYVGAFTAVLFIMLHPVNVESVAAITSRKELLYALFCILALRSYTSAQADHRNLSAAVLFASLAQLSKGAAFIIPLMFLTYEIIYRRLYLKLKVRVLPLAISMLVSWSIFGYQLYVAFQKVLETEGLDVFLAAKVGGTIRIFNIMLLKLVYPAGLSYEYEIRWPQGLNLSPEWVIPIIVIVAVLYLALKKRHIVLFLALMSLIPLGPYLNIIPIRHGYQDYMVHYDHYLLMPLALSAPLLARTISHVPDRSLRWLIAIAAIVMALFAYIDYQQSGIWKNKVTLYERCIETAPDIARSYYFLGEAYIDNKRYEDAAIVLSTGYQLDSNDMNILKSLGDSYSFGGKYAEAEKLYKEHLQHSYDIGVIQNLTNTLILQGKFEEARSYLNIWLAKSPGQREALHTQRFLQTKESESLRKEPGRSSTQEP